MNKEKQNENEGKVTDSIIKEHQVDNLNIVDKPHKKESEVKTTWKSFFKSKWKRYLLIFFIPSLFGGLIIFSVYWYVVKDNNSKVINNFMNSRINDRSFWIKILNLKENEELETTHNAKQIMKLKENHTDNSRIVYYDKDNFKYLIETKDMSSQDKEWIKNKNKVSVGLETSIKILKKDGKTTISFFGAAKDVENRVRSSSFKYKIEIEWL